VRIGRSTLLALGVAATLAACTEDATAPGRCPAFCPGGQIQLVDTVLYVISRDSSFVGYVQADSSALMLAVNAFGLDSRPIFLLGPVAAHAIISTTDTGYTNAISVDSATLTLNLVRRDTLATNLRLNLYRLPTTIDTSATLASLSGPFTDSLLRSLNLDSIRALAGGVDSVAGDSVTGTDSLHIGLRVVIHLDSAQANYVAADSGRSAFGIRITADSLASVAFTSVQGGAGPVLTWWGTFDSAGTNVHRSMGAGANVFNSSVSNVSAPVLDSNLLVGGVPSARSLLRFAIPRSIRDSTQVVRATLLLFPVTAPVGVPTDSILLNVARISTDIGAKSPCVPVPAVCAFPGLGDSSVLVSTGVPIGHGDTIATDITLILHAWQGDTLAPQALMLSQSPEGGNLVSLRINSSRTTAFRPALHLTYVPRYRFGTP
jgi:hypothetical protein